jgi:hypothetical protein
MLYIPLSFTPERRMSAQSLKLACSSFAVVAISVNTLSDEHLLFRNTTESSSWRQAMDLVTFELYIRHQTCALPAKK